MRDPRTTIVAAGLVALGALGVSALGAGLRVTRPVSTVSLLNASSALPAMRPAADLLPALEARVRQRPESANAHHMLAVVLGRAVRETGDESRLGAAEIAARRAVQLRPNFPAARAELARALARQHAFAPALEVASEALRRWPDRPDLLAAIVDASLGLGRYEEAADALAALSTFGSSPAILARQAAAAELHGRDHEALELLVRAATRAHERYQARSEVAWYQARVAEFLRRRGQAAAALQHAAAALRLAPGHLWAERVRAQALVATGQLDAGIEATEALVRRLPHPEVHAALGDLYELAGRRGAAARAWAEALRVGDEAGEAEDRPMARLLADHGWRPAEAVERAQRDLLRRQDLDAWDTLAWALCRAERFEEAAAASERARATGARRADYEFHAGMIESARGNVEQAGRHLREALAIDPRFDPRLAPVARRQLASLSDPDPSP